MGHTFQYPFKPRSFVRCAHVCDNLGDHETRYVTCEEPVKGRFVVVYGEERGQIQMCEFEVFGNVISGSQLTRDGFFYQYAEFVFGMVLILPKSSVCTSLHKINDPKRLFVTSICFSLWKSCNDFSWILADLVNVAVNKSVFMSSTDGNSTAELAVDGYARVDPKFCSQTTNQIGAWLVVNLQAEFWISSVIITNGGLPHLLFIPLII